LNVGGVDESNCLNSIEKYDPKSGLWAPFSSLPRMMCGSGMQVLDSVPLSLALPSRKRKALYVDAGLGTSGPITGPQGIVPGVDALNLEAEATFDDDEYYDDTEPLIVESDYYG
jgi:Kelch motif